MVREHLRCTNYLNNKIMQGKISNLFNCTIHQYVFTSFYVLLGKLPNCKMVENILLLRVPKKNSVGGFGVLSP